MLRLSIAYLRDRPFTTLLNIILLGLATATLIILVTVSTQLGTRIEKDARGIDLVVGAKGSPLQLILSSIYQVDAPTGNIPAGTVDLLRRNPSVAQVIPMALGDNFRGFRIVGTEAAYLDLYGAGLASGKMNVKEGEALLGADVARVTGATLGQQFVGSHGLGSGEGAGQHEHDPMTTVGILKPTGTVIDRLIIVSVPTVWHMHGIDHDHDGEHKQGKHEDGEAHAHEKGHDHGDEAKPDVNDLATGGERAEMQADVTALLVKYRNAMGAVSVPSLINAQAGMQAAVPAIETTRLLSFLGVGLDAIEMLGWLIAFTGGLAIFVALLNALDAREKDLALLRVMGATKGSIFGTILVEGLLTAALGAVLGVLLGHGVIAAAAATSPRLQELGLNAYVFHPAELAIVGAVLSIGILAAFIPAIRLFRVDLTQILARAA
jgi:putative ABC transport system permease protein